MHTVNAALDLRQSGKRRFALAPHRQRTAIDATVESIFFRGRREKRPDADISHAPTTLGGRRLGWVAGAARDGGGGLHLGDKINPQHNAKQPNASGRPAGINNSC